MAPATKYEIDVEAFLGPITSEAPTGLYLRYNDSKDKQVMASVKIYHDLEECRREEEDAKSQGEWERKNRKKADWPQTLELATKLLQGHTKDLQVAVWLVEAAGRLRGIAGIRDGVLLLDAILDRFWDGIHPCDDDPEERLELRSGGLEWLDSPAILPLMIFKEPIVRIPQDPTIRYSSLDEKNIRDFEEVCRKRKDGDEPSREDLEAQWKEDGKIRIDAFQGYVKATPRAFYEGLRDEIATCREAIEALNEHLAAEDRFGEAAPTLMRTLQDLETCRERVERILRDKTAEAPASENETELGTTDEEEQGTESSQGDEAADESESESESVEEEATPRPVPRPSGRPRGGPIADADDAAIRVAQAAAFLRQADPGDPAPYLVLAALRMGESYRSGGWTDGGSAPAPPTDVRQALRQLAREGDWTGILAEAERALASPAGQGWLDAHRLAIQALAEQGYEPASRAARALLGGWLADQPDWPSRELDDDTPAANGESRSWAADFARPTPPTEPTPPPLPEPAVATTRELGNDTGEKPIDPWDQARELVGQNRIAEAIGLLDRAARSAATGRERFLRRLQQAQVCASGRRPDLALLLFEELTRQIDAHRLEDWEGSSLCGQVLAGLYRCLKPTQPERATAVYTRLCQLDLSLALACDSE